MAHFRGRHVRLLIEEFNGSRTRYLKVKDMEGRPVKVLKWFIDLGFDQKWFNDKVFEDLIVFGWDRGYLKSDAGILALPFKYFLKDMDWSKRKRLKEVDKNGDV